jgi:UDP-N-acetylglucosamine acyltransferase
MTIHKTAVISKEASIDDGVEIGAYAVIDGNVVIGAGSTVAPHAVVSGPTIIGKNNAISSFTSIGAPPQDLSYKGEPTKLIIGDNNYIREYVSIHRGTVSGKGQTVIGNDNLLMAYVHIAHDCIIGNNVVMANAATLAGHVEIADRASLGGLVAIHQFCRVGESSYIGGLSGLSLDVPPFVIVAGTRNQMRIAGLNKIGLRRNGYNKEDIKMLNKAFKIIFRSPDLLLKDALERVRTEMEHTELIKALLDFIATSKRGVTLKTIDD